MIEAAEHWQVDRSTVTRIRTVAKEGALAALAQSRPGSPTKERNFELDWRRPGPTPPAWARRSRRWQSSSCWWREKGAGAETSTQVQIVFADALAAEGLQDLIDARHDRGVDPKVDDERRPILLAMSDNGPR